MTPAQAATKAFARCHSNSQQSRSMASYLAKQYLLSRGVGLAEVIDAMPKINKLLDKSFAARAAVPQSRPIHRRLSSAPPVTADDVAPPPPIES